MIRATLGLGLVVALPVSQCRADVITTPTTAQAMTTATAGITSVTVAVPEVVGTTVTLPSGLKYIDTVIGKGPYPGEKQTVSVHYTGTLENGKVFDSSRLRVVPVPLKFQFGTSSVIPGIEEGVKTMRLGGRRILIVPPKLGYGQAGAGLIPPDATLRFDVELVSIN